MRKIYEDKPNFGRKGSKKNEMTSILDYFTLLIPLEFISDAMIDHFMTAEHLEHLWRNFQSNRVCVSLCKTQCFNTVLCVVYVSHTIT